MNAVRATSAESERSLSAPDLPLWLWGAVPGALAVGLVVLALVDAEAARRLMAKDEQGGAVEAATVLVLLPAIASGVVAWRRAARRVRSGGSVPRSLPPWIAAWTLACVYFAGEEISWGQWLFGWTTPDAIAALNDQGETNLHNMTSWLDQKPRVLVELWIAVAGLVLPLARRLRGRRSSSTSARGAWFLPTMAAAPSAALTLLARVPEPLGRAAGWPHLDPLGSSELRELTIAMFLAVYLGSLAMRLRDGLSS